MPLNLDITAELAFAHDYFDAVFCMDSVHYFGGTLEFARATRPGQIGRHDFRVGVWVMEGCDRLAAKGEAADGPSKQRREVVILTDEMVEDRPEIPLQDGPLERILDQRVGIGGEKLLESSHRPEVGLIPVNPSHHPFGPDMTWP